MADKRITDLTALAQAGVDASLDLLPIADVSASETKKVSPVDLVVAANALLPPGSIPGTAIQGDSITAAQLGPDSVGASELADNSVDTAAIQQGAVTGGATGPIAQNTITADNIAAGAVGSSEIAAGAVGGTAIAAGVIDSTHIQANSLGANALAPDSVGQSELADGSVDTPALIDAAVTTPKIDNGAVTDDKLASGIDGSKLQAGSVGTNQVADGSITSDKISSVSLDKLGTAGAGTVLAGPVTGSAVAPIFRRLVGTDLPIATDVNLGGVIAPAAGGLSVSAVGEISITNTVAPGTQPVVTYNAHGLITSGRALQAGDLPIATSVDLGAVIPGDGLSVRGTGALDVTPATDAFIGGVIKGDGLIVANDGTLSVAPPDATTLGGVKAGDGIQISVDGTIHQAVTGVAAGQYTKLTTDERGNITDATNLVASDIPNIQFGQVDNVAIGSSELLQSAVQQHHLAPDSVTVVGDQAPPLKGTPLYSSSFATNLNGDPVRGSFWFDNAANRLYVWEGTKWEAVFEDLSQNNLRYGGNVDADTGLITLVNSYGASAGYAVGEAPRTVSKDTVGLYFVCDTGTAAGVGFTVTQLAGVTFDAGDWILASKAGQAGTDDGWRRIDTITTGGGGGGGGGGALANHNFFSATHADVVANGTIEAAQIVKAVDVGGGAIQWQNTSEIDCGSNDYA